MAVRVRYAPSPTGLQHIGGVRTALFNWLFARSQGGAAILRIEDTDRERYDGRSLQDIYDGFAWLGLPWDEGPDVGGAYGPYIQSERAALYRDYAERLVESGAAYRAWDSPEEVAQLRASNQGYDRRGRTTTPQEIEQRSAQGIVPVIRFRGAMEGSTTFDDLLLGEVRFRNDSIIADPVLLKSDGYPTYHLANVVDDHLMQISHVLRSQEWLSSTALHLLLYEAFGWEAPRFCHLPMVLGADGQKLSKRHGDTTLAELRSAGYLPEAILNYIALLGWSYDGSREEFTLDELANYFTLDGLNRASSTFDYRKLDWLNGLWIRRMPPMDLARRLVPFLEGAGLLHHADAPEKRLLPTIDLIQERLKRLSDAPAMLRFLFEKIEPPPAEEIIPKRLDADATIRILNAVLDLLAPPGGPERRLDDIDDTLLRSLAERLRIRFADLMMTLRVAITGSRVSPPLLGSIRLLGARQTVNRIEQARRMVLTKPQHSVQP